LQEKVEPTEGVKLSGSARPTRPGAPRAVRTVKG